MQLLGSIGFVGATVVARFDCFKGTSKENIARKYGVTGVNLLAVRRA